MSARPPPLSQCPRTCLLFPVRGVISFYAQLNTFEDTHLHFFYKDYPAHLFCYGFSSTPKQVKLIVANEIVPHLLAEEYMDKGEYENELRQVIGDTKTAFDISEHDVLIFGEEGLMLVGPNSRHHEPLLCSYLEVGV